MVMAHKTDFDMLAVMCEIQRIIYLIASVNKIRINPKHIFRNRQNNKTINLFNPNIIHNKSKTRL